MANKRISATDFIKRCGTGKKGKEEMFIGSWSTDDYKSFKQLGFKNGAALIAELQLCGLKVEFDDNPVQKDYSSTMYITNRLADDYVIGQKIDHMAFIILMRMKPDEFGQENDGAFRLWWD